MINRIFYQSKKTKSFLKKNYKRINENLLNNKHNNLFDKINLCIGNFCSITIKPYFLYDESSLFNINKIKDVDVLIIIYIENQILNENKKNFNENEEFLLFNKNKDDIEYILNKFKKYIVNSKLNFELHLDISSCDKKTLKKTLDWILGYLYINNNNYILKYINIIGFIPFEYHDDDNNDNLINKKKEFDYLKSKFLLFESLNTIFFTLKDDQKSSFKNLGDIIETINFDTKKFKSTIYFFMNKNIKNIDIINASNDDLDNIFFSLYNVLFMLIKMKTNINIENISINNYIKKKNYNNIINNNDNKKMKNNDFCYYNNKDDIFKNKISINILKNLFFILKTLKYLNIENKDFISRKKLIDLKFLEEEKDDDKKNGYDYDGDNNKLLFVDNNFDDLYIMKNEEQIFQSSSSSSSFTTPLSSSFLSSSSSSLPSLFSPPLLSPLPSSSSSLPFDLKNNEDIINNNLKIVSLLYPIKENNKNFKTIFSTFCDIGICTITKTLKIKKSSKDENLKMLEYYFNNIKEENINYYTNIEIDNILNTLYSEFFGIDMVIKNIDFINCLELYITENSSFNIFILSIIKKIFNKISETKRFFNIDYFIIKNSILFNEDVKLKNDKKIEVNLTKYLNIKKEILMTISLYIKDGSHLVIGNNNELDTKNDTIIEKLCYENNIILNIIFENITKFMVMEFYVNYNLNKTNKKICEDFFSCFMKNNQYEISQIQKSNIKKLFFFDKSLKSKFYETIKKENKYIETKYLIQDEKNT